MQKYKEMAGDSCSFGKKIMVCEWGFLQPCMCELPSASKGQVHCSRFSSPHRLGTDCHFHEKIVSLVYQFPFRGPGGASGIWQWLQNLYRSRKNCTVLVEFTKWSCSILGLLWSRIFPVLGGTTFGFVRLDSLLAASNFFQRAEWESTDYCYETCSDKRTLFQWN